MRIVNNQEYLELMNFISSKARDLFEHEIQVSQAKSQIPKNEFQGKFHIRQCFALEKGDRIVYCIYTKRFLNFSRDVLPQIVSTDPDLFRNTDARDVLKILNETSGYATYNRSPNDYLTYISQEAFVYVILKNKNGFEDRVLRIDLCRNIKPTYANYSVYEFQGGLLHAMKHFKMDDSMTVDSAYDLEHLVWLCICAFLKIPTDKINTTYTIYIPLQFSRNIIQCQQMTGNKLQRFCIFLLFMFSKGKKDGKGEKVA